MDLQNTETAYGNQCYFGPKLYLQPPEKGYGYSGQDDICSNGGSFEGVSSQPNPSPAARHRRANQAYLERAM